MVRRREEPPDEPAPPPAHSKALAMIDPDSCLNRASDDEPVFILRGNDELAADTIRGWAERYRASKSPDDPKALAKYLEAYECARAMTAWNIGRDMRDMGPPQDD